VQLEVIDRRKLAEDIDEFTLVSVNGTALPPAEAGAHITIETPAGCHRRYSLVHPDQSPSTYTIAVKRESDSRGGSASMHDDVQKGSLLEVEAPGNEFPLSTSGPVLLIAGGIGITPIYAMAQQLKADKRPFRLIYCTRSAAQTAYAEELETLCEGNLVLHHDGGDIDAAFDFWDIFAEPTAEHVFCCGPSPLMEEVRAVSGLWPEGRIHFEDFKPVEAVRENDRPFTVTLAKSGADVTVPADRTILEALRDAGYKLPSSCESGTCGTCKTGLLEGEVEHRDMVLMDDEKADKIMICVSRAVGDRLVLDI